MRSLFIRILVTAIGLMFAMYLRAQNTYPWPSNGNIGIGTTSPAYPLTVKSTGTNQFAAIVLNSNGAQIFGIWNQNDGDATMVLNSASGSENIFFNTTGSSYFKGGNVGIGTISPGATLEVNGNLKLTANSGASITFPDGTMQTTAYTGVSCGGDFAESVKRSDKLRGYEPGDVLVLTTGANDDVTEASGPYSTMVAGIYSTKPGFVGRRLTGGKGPGELPLAMVGIVPTKVSAENGAIHKGDLLVTASLRGYAMKGTDRTRMLGAVVGKAMGSLEVGTGVIEVLVTLQ